MNLPLPTCQMVFVCGPVASGKTYLIRQWLEKENRYVIFDGTGEFLDDNREQVWANPKALRDRLRINPYYYRLVYQPGRNRTNDFGHILNTLWWSDEPKLLVCDEFHEVCPVEATTEEVEMMLRFARHDKLGFVGASQRIADVHKLFTGGCRMVVLFCTHEGRDLEAIDKRWRCADLVENLRPLLFDDIHKKVLQIPQAVICMKGQRPFIHDFGSDAPIAPVETSPDETLPEPAVEEEEGQ